MNGLDLARAVRKKHPDLLVVLAPGYSDAAGQAAEFTVLRVMRLRGVAVGVQPFEMPTPGLLERPFIKA
jgi:hypothetical protein